MDENRIEHPAGVAWMQLQAYNLSPSRIEVISDNDKSSVYRLHGVGPLGIPLIAKRSELASLRIERTVFEGILPGLPFPTLRFYGAIEESDGKHGWVFLEDAGDQPVSPHDKGIEELISTSIAAIHVAGENSEVARRLPERGPGYFLARLRRIRSSLQTRLTSLQIDGEEAQILRDFLGVADQLELDWHVIESFCSGIPRTLIHGDLAPENLRIRMADGKPELLILDWEKAGSGVPAVDLTWVDPVIYWSIVCVQWPALQLVDVEQLQRYGRIFRTLVHDIGGKPAHKIERYTRRLANAMSVADLAR